LTVAIAVRTAPRSFEISGHCTAVADFDLSERARHALVQQQMLDLVSAPSKRLFASSQYASLSDPESALSDIARVGKTLHNSR
jgi:hypothetical protein